MLQSLPNAVLTELKLLYVRKLPLRKLNSKAKFSRKALPPIGAKFLQRAWFFLEELQKGPAV